MDSLFDILLGKSLSGGSGGGGGGTSNYNALENKPSINSVTLTGNKSLSDLGIAAASDIPTVNNGTLTIQKNGQLVNTFKANQASDVTVNITVPTTAADVSALPSSTKYAAALSLTINSSTYVVTGQLKDQNGNNLGSAQTIDLPLETMVVGGSYDDEHKKIILTLKNGNTVDIPVADLISGLQTELSATNKLNPAYIDYDSTHAAVTDAEKTTWSGKQDALTFDGTYSASTNKAATVSTVTNAINALDVTGASGISAAKTISAWSETDGKVSVSTQDIAIAGTQAVLTGYQKSTTAGQAVAATDNVNQAIGKVEKRVSDNENNILSTAVYGTCDTAGNVAAKVVDVPSGFVLRAGCVIGVRFANSNSASNVTLNVGNTGDKSIRLGTSVYAGSRTNITGNANYTIYYMYDGEYWGWVSNGILQPAMTAAEATSGTSTADRFISAKVLSDAIDEKLVPVENNISFNTNEGFLCKNLSPWSGGTASADNTYLVRNEPITLPAGTYLVSYLTTATSGRAEVQFRNDSVSVGSVTLNHQSGRVSGTVTLTSAATNMSMFTMRACTVSEFMVSPTTMDTTYQPYALSNAAITPALKECVNNGAKNLLDFSGSTPIAPPNCTMTNNGDGTFTITKTSSNLDIPYIAAQLKAGTYIYSGCPAGGSDSTYRLDIRTATGSTVGEGDYGSGVKVTIPSDGWYRITCRLNSTYTTTGLTIKPMLCDPALWAISPTFEPYTLSNADLTAKEQTNENNISLLYKGGSANILKNTAQTQTVGGVTFTTNADGSVTANGTKNNNDWLYLSTGNSLKRGTYVLSSGGIIGDDKLVIITTGESLGTAIMSTNTATGVYERELTQDYSNLYYAIRIASGTVCNNLTFKPMLCEKNVYEAINGEFQPYAMSNAELTEGVTQIQSDVGAPTITSSTTLADYANTLSRGYHSGFFTSGSKPSDAPVSDNCFCDFMIYSASTAMIRVYPTGTAYHDAIYYRTKVSGTWQSWFKFQGTAVT